MEAPELTIPVEREVEVRTLEVRPPVSGAAEDPVERLVDDVVLVGPQVRLLRRIHPWVDAARKETAAEIAQCGIGGGHLGSEVLTESSERGRRSVGLQLQYMEDQLVGPRDLAPLELRHGLAGHRLHEPVAHRPDVQLLLVDDHVLDLDAIPVEEAQAAHLRVPRASRRRAKKSMTVS